RAESGKPRAKSGRQKAEGRKRNAGCGAENAKGGRRSAEGAERESGHRLALHRDGQPDSLPRPFTLRTPHFACSVEDLEGRGPGWPGPSAVRATRSGFSTEHTLLSALCSALCTLLSAFRTPPSAFRSLPPGFPLGFPLSA